MLLESLEENTFKENEWIYFAVAVDYEKMEAVLYLEIYDLENPHSRTKQIKLFETDLELTKKFSVGVNKTNNNKFFDNSQPIMGAIYKLGIANFTEPNMLYFSLGHLSNSKLQRNGILMDLFADIYNEKDPLKSKGQIVGEYIVHGKHEIIFKENPEKIGVRFFEEPLSLLTIGSIEIPSSTQQELSFYFKLSYKENLSDQFFLLKYGTEGTSGYLELKLKKLSSGRAVDFKIIGTGDVLVWESPYSLPEDTMVEFNLGFVISAAKTVHLVYSDSLGN